MCINTAHTLLCIQIEHVQSNLFFDLYLLNYPSGTSCLAPVSLFSLVQCGTVAQRKIEAVQNHC